MRGDRCCDRREVSREERGEKCEMRCCEEGGVKTDVMTEERCEGRCHNRREVQRHVMRGERCEDRCHDRRGV